ncbi:MAG: ShlB/FhaC/HecB family hemolysin secretion/activation protein [Fusobacterium sp.]|uniref:ShlB/FhaC/HecB family hemolysin secretion/activation protein n=1 Tax=Fusobacterium sp. TaxID=68766 RepID=UPI0026DA8E51|nr:ShlB/FhaC/HecB family hemolysin secretion/activation protein [Fusobacterium sp.]MDO4691028.1 ShlB/FhaC/HecB family hemolysin secretion/activation protein [Fusobacterium sp.]
MFKKILFCFLGILTYSYANNLIDTEKRRDEQSNFENLIKNKHFDVQKNKEIAQTEELIVDVNSITLEGNSIFEKFQINSLFKKFIGKNINIYSLINNLENKYIEKGYITTRVGLNMEKSDLEKGKISLFVLEGKIDKIFYDGKENKFKTFITFPERENKILNIRDLDQGIDNLADSSTMDIKASTEESYSNIFINRKNKVLNLAINYNDLGQKETGRHRLKYSLNLHNLIGLNESIDFSYQMKMQRQYKDSDANNFSLNVIVPFKNWNFNYSYDESETFRTIYSLRTKYKSSSETKNESFGIRKLIYRNENNKIDFGVKVTLKDSKNYIDDIKLTTGSRKLSVLTLDTAYTGRMGGGLLSSSLSTSFGLKKFGANIDDNEWYREKYSPKAQFRKYNLNISWYRPVNKFYYKINLGGQYSKNILYSQEKLGIGDDTTVRGFKDESLQGDKGFYIRNEIGYKGLQFLEPYIAYDYGRTFNNKIKYEKPATIQGVSIGLKVYFKSFEGSISLSKPVDRPSYFEKNKAILYTSLTYRF